MTRNIANYCLRIIILGAAVPPIPAIVVAAISFFAHLANGYSFLECLNYAVFLFVWMFFLVWIIFSVWVISAAAKKAKGMGVSLDYLGSMSWKEQKKWEREHDF